MFEQPLVAIATRTSKLSWPPVLVVALLLAAISLARADDTGATAEQLFERRIMPIFKSPNPSSCTECHLAGVDLKQYIRPSHEQTFLSLRDQGLVDLDRPEESKILKLIAMRDPAAATAAGTGVGANLIHEKTRQAEFEAFAAWIRASAADARLRGLPPLPAKDRAAPKRPVEVIRHARKDRLLESFENTIWAMRFRCMNCHIEGTKENDKLRAEHGDQVAWMKAAGPEATMNYLLTTKLIDRKRPERSLLLLKPSKEVDHVGGKKFLAGDQGYQAFRSWIEDYVRIARDGYPTAASLPKPDGIERFATEIWLKLTNTPAEWGDALLQADVHAWDAERKVWQAEPIASSDRAVWGKGKQWQHTLTLAAPADSPQADAWRRGKPSLPAGVYQVRIYLDRTGRKQRDWKSTLSRADFLGSTEINTRWSPGNGSMTVVDASKIAK